MRFLLLGWFVSLVAACSLGPGGRPDAGNPGYGGGPIAPNVVLIDPHTERVYAVKSVAGAVVDNAGPVSPPILPGCDAAVFDAAPTGIDASTDLDGIGAVDVPDSGPRHNEVWSIDPDIGTTRHVSSFDDQHLVTLSFPQSRLLYDIASPTGVELRLQDPNTLGIVARQPVELGYTALWDTLSPSELYLASTGTGPLVQTAPDVIQFASALFVADTRTLETHATLCAGGAPTWLHTGDRFLVNTYHDAAMGALHHRLRLYAIADLQRLGFATAPDGSWQGSTLDVDTDLLDVAVSPDDQWVAGSAEGGGVTILSLATQSPRHIAGVNGPVIFTPSSSMVVAWRSSLDTATGVDAGDSAIVLIDVATGSTTFIDTGFADNPVYFIASDGHRIVILSWLATVAIPEGGLLGHNVQLAIGDLDMHTMTASALIDRASPSLGAFVDRRGHQELWFLHDDSGRLDRLDLVTGTYEMIFPSFHARGIGYLPMRDTFVFSEESPPAVRFWSPATRMTLRDVPY